MSVSSTCRGWQLLVMLDRVVPATRKALNRAGLSIDDIDDIDVFEVTRSVCPRPAGKGRASSTSTRTS